MKKLKLNWSFGNSKLKKTGTISFNLPAGKSSGGFITCPGAGACLAVCYAQQGRYCMPNVQAPREANLAIARHTYQLLDALLHDLKLIKQTSIRIHDSGDFFSQDYLDAWRFVAAKNPDKLFYAYTKSLHLDFRGLPPNFIIIQSVGGRFDKLVNPNMPIARIFDSRASLQKAGYQNGSATDKLAQQGAPRIGLVYHGQRKLTDQQKTYFKKVA